MPALDTASKLHRALRCLYSCAPQLPRVEEPSGEAAQLGTAVHELIEKWLSGDTGTLLYTADRRISYLRQLLRSSVGNAILDSFALPPECRFIETSFAVDVQEASARVLGGNRLYKHALHTEIVGTLDYAYLDVNAGEIHVYDWKTGNKANVCAANVSEQLMFGALAMLWSRGTVEVERISCHYVFIDGSCDPATIDTVSFDGPDFAEISEFSDRLWRAHKLAARGDYGFPVPGEHCRYCPVAKCPTRMDAIETVSPLVETVNGFEIPSTSTDITCVEHAAWLLDMITRSQALIRQLQTVLDSYAKDTPVPMPGGRVYGLRESQRETIDLEVPGAVEAVQGALGPLARSAFEVSTSKAALGRSGASKDQIGDALQRLRDVGAIRVSTSKLFGSYLRKG